MQSSTLDRKLVEQLVRQVLRQQYEGRIFRASGQSGGPNPLVVNVSARHMHITQEDLEVLFGKGSKLTKLKDLYQEGEFASEQLVTLIGPRNRVIPNVRILGPCRKMTQIELSYTDGIFMGLDLPLRISGDIEGTPGIVVIGPAGALTLTKGVIRAARHVHMNDADMSYYGVKDGDAMKLRIAGPCGATLENMRVRYHPKVKLEIHIDTDEGNACHLDSSTHMELLK
ncbi:MAG: phosphate propanoyltransferase [Phycisphaerae bacterium]